MFTIQIIYSEHLKDDSIQSFQFKRKHILE